MQLKKLGEFSLINKIRGRCRTSLPDMITGIGDDAAAFKPKKGRILVTTDMMVEDIHFDLSFTDFSQLGYKLLAVNVSDIYAMGGRPQYFLLSLAIPDNYNEKDIKDLYSGIMKMAGESGVSVIGGDTCSSKNGLVLSGTLIGNANRVILRSGARPGDGIYVTDTLGDSAMGLVLLKKRKKRISRFSQPAPHVKLMKKHLLPEPLPLKKTKGITAMIDISDGLLADLSHICEESRTGAVIYEDRIPLSEELRLTAKRLGIDPLRFALRGGEDYALLFTAPHDKQTDAYRIGEIARKGRFIVDPKGNKKRFKPEGYEHFKKTVDSSQ